MPVDLMAWIWLNRLIFSRAEDVADYAKILVEFNSRSQRAAATASGYGRGSPFKAQVFEVDDVTLLRRRKRFDFGYRILRPIQINASEIRLLGREHDGRFFRLVANLHLALGGDLGRQRIDGSKRKEGWRLDHARPVKRIDPRGISGDAKRLNILIRARGQRIDGAAMLVITQAPQRDHAQQRD